MVQQNPLPQPQGEPDPKLTEFLQRTVNNFIRWDLVRFFHDNPHAMDTAANIAQYTGRDAEPVEAELFGLVSAGVLRVQQAGGRHVFSLSPDQNVRDLIKRFVLACDDRNFRVQAIRQVIHASQ